MVLKKVMKLENAIREPPILQMGEDVSETSQKILEMLKAHRTTQEISRELGINHHSLMQKLNRMRKKGLVKATGNTLNRCYDVADKVSQAVASVASCPEVKVSQASLGKSQA